MSAIDTYSTHKHVPRGNAGMSKPMKEHKIGNTTVIIHSPLVEMTSEERSNWFNREWENSNPILKEIAQAVNACYQHH